VIAYIEAQGSLLLMKVRGGQYSPVTRGGKRGRIRSFSSQARRRILRFMARIRAGGQRAVFVTLTFKGYPTNAQAKETLRRLKMRISRKHNNASFVWRMEYQRRGSIHFHLICFNLPFWKQSDLQQVWTECTGEVSSRADIRLIRSKRGVMHYVSKYIAKRPEKGRKTSLVYAPYLHASRKWRKGRFWGYHNAKRLPLGQKLTGVLVNDTLIKRLAAFAWSIVGTENQYGALSFHLFWDGALLLCHNCVDEGGLDMDEYRSSCQINSRDYANWEWLDKHFPSAEQDALHVQPKSASSWPAKQPEVQPLTKRWLNKAFRSDRAGSISELAIGDIIDSIC